jgi:hypothetical protein
VRLPWLFCYLTMSVGCTDQGLRSASAPERADFLPTTAESLEALQEEPQLLLRCEGGRVGAYLVVATPDDFESGEADDRAVPVKLDSVLAC